MGVYVNNITPEQGNFHPLKAGKNFLEITITNNRRTALPAAVVGYGVNWPRYFLALAVGFFAADFFVGDFLAGVEADFSGGTRSSL